MKRASFRVVFRVGWRGEEISGERGGGKTAWNYSLYLKLWQPRRECKKFASMLRGSSCAKYEISEARERFTRYDYRERERERLMIYLCYLLSGHPSGYKQNKGETFRGNKRNEISREKDEKKYKKKKKKRKKERISDLMMRLVRSAMKSTLISYTYARYS